MTLPTPRDREEPDAINANDAIDANDANDAIDATDATDAIETLVRALDEQISESFF